MDNNPKGWEQGLTIEHVMLSVTVVSTKESAGQFDDSIAYLVGKHLPEYHGVVSVSPQVLYQHTKIEQHILGCGCGYCMPNRVPVIVTVPQNEYGRFRLTYPTLEISNPFEAEIINGDYPFRVQVKHTELVIEVPREWCCMRESLIDTIN